MTAVARKPKKAEPVASPPEAGKPAPTQNHFKRLVRRNLSRIHVSAPLSTAATLAVLAVSTFAIYWNQTAQINTIERTRRAQLQASVETFASVTETLLSNNDYASVRRLNAELAQQHQLDVSRIVTASGLVLASTDRTDTIATSFPDLNELKAVSLQSHAIEFDSSKRWKAVYPIAFAGRNIAQLEADTVILADEDGMVLTRNIAGIGSMGLLGLTFVLGSYKYMRRRTDGLTHIRDSLHAISEGENEIEALRVCEKAAIEAKVLNRLLEDNARLAQEILDVHVTESLAVNGMGNADLQAACDALRQGLIILNDKLVTMYANGAGAIYVQTRRDEIGGMHVDQYIKNEDVLQALKDSVGSESAVRKVVLVERAGKQGTDSLRFNIRSINRGNTRNFIVVIEDITQQRVAEESRNSFVAHATHELRMPLTNIRLYLETALEEGENNPKLRGECLNVINEESQRLERLVSDMLSMSEIEAGSLKIEKDDVRLDALFDELERDYRALAAEKNVELKFELPPKLPVLFADRNKLTIAIQNLIGNGIKYTPGGGKVRVDVEAKDGQLIVQFIDTGIGMSEEDTKLIFEKFYRADDERVRNITGSGLGLALSREIIRLHNGDITVKSQIDQGSIFTLTMPIGKAE